MRGLAFLSVALSLSLSLISPVSADDAARAKFAKLAARNGGVVKLDSKLYDELTKPGRDWSAVIEFTALGKEYNCAPCHQFNPNFRAVAKSWTKVAKEPRDHHFFATLDFADGSSVFRQLGYASAPVVNFHIAESGPYKAPANRANWQYDFNRNSFEPEMFAEQLSEATPVKVPYSPPLNYGLILTTLTTIGGGAVLAVFFWPIFSVIFLSRWTWAIGCILSSLIFTSGYMFTRIRHTPFAQNSKHGPQWIAGGYSNQFGAETWVISSLYGALALSQVALILLVPRTLKPAQQRTAIYIWCAVTVLLYSVLMSVFRLKNASYPFRLLF